MDKNKRKHYESITEKHGLADASYFEYLAQLYTRLQNELDKRDFSGLPTDKLYNIMNDVRERLTDTGKLND